MDNTTSSNGPDLYGTECVQKVRVLVDRGPKPAIGVLARLDKLQNLCLVHSVQLPHEVHGRQTPVDPTHPEELCHTVLLEDAQKPGVGGGEGSSKGGRAEARSGEG